MEDGTSTRSQASDSRLETWDYVTMSCVVLLASSVGIYHVFAGRRSKDAREFLVNTHELGVVPLILSATASFISAVTILGFPVEAYTNGAIFVSYSLAPLILAPLCVFLYLPVFFNLGTRTIFEYLEYRFNRFLRLSASVLMNVSCMLYTSCVIYAPALALNQVTGLDLWFSVISIGVICVLYTSMGGLKAVVWADVAQMLVMVTVLCIIIFRGVVDIGGVSEVWRIATEGKRGDIFIFSSTPNSAYTSWTILLGGSMQIVGPIAINQLMMQRFLSNSTLKKANISFISSCIGVSLMTFLSTYGGLVFYARYHDCDPLLSGRVTSRDQLMALFGIETLSFWKGLPGIFVGSILCATLSTLSSTLNSLTAVTMEDYVRPCFPDISDATAMRLSKILGIVYGIICVALVAVAESMGGVATAVFKINGMTTGPVLSLFTIGMLLPWISTLGAACGFFVSILINSWAVIGSLITKPILPMAPFSSDGCDVKLTNDFFSNGSTPIILKQVLNETQNAALFGNADVVPVADAVDGFPLYAMQAMWYTFSSLCISLLVSIIVSLIFGMQNPSDLDPKLISPITTKICSQFSVKVQEKLGYGPTKKAMSQHETQYSELPLKVVLTYKDFRKDPIPSANP